MSVFSASIYLFLDILVLFLNSCGMELVLFSNRRMVLTLLCGLTYNALYFWCRSPVRTPPRRRAYSRSPSRSPRRRRRSLSPDRPARGPRVVHSTVRRSYSRSPIRRRNPPTYRSPVRRRYSSRSPPARRSSSYSLSPVPRSRARLLLRMPVYERNCS